MSVRDDLATRFVCPKCESPGANVRLISTGGTFARVFTSESNRFLAATCRRCSYTELYDASILDGPDGGGVFDLIF